MTGGSILQDPMMSNEESVRITLNGKEEPFSMLTNRHADWRIWLGLGLTISWLVLLSLYIAGTVGWKNAATAPIEQVGSFLEGAFAPLAFLWLVIGYFLQKKELMQNTDAIKMQYVEIQKVSAAS